MKMQSVERNSQETLIGKLISTLEIIYSFLSHMRPYIITLSIISNSLTVLVIYKFKTGVPINAMLIALSFTDLSFTVCLIIKAIVCIEYSSPSPSFEFNPKLINLRRFIKGLTNGFRASEICLTILIAVQRYEIMISLNGPIRIR